MSKLVIPGVVAQTGSGGGGGDVPQNTNPLDRLIAEDYITAYPFVDLDPDAEEPIVIYLPTFDIIEEAPDVAPRRFVGVLPADIAETEHDWEFEIVQYVAKEAWYHLIGTDMVFFVTQDVETFDWVTDDRIYPIEATLPGYSTSGKKLIVNDSTENVKWVTDNKLENTATGADSLTLLNTNGTSRGTSIVIGKSATAVSYTGMISIGNSARTSGSNGIAIGSQAQANSTNAISIGSYTFSQGVNSIAIGTGNTGSFANANASIQLGEGTNSTANSFQVYSYPMLDGTTGKIPSDRINIDGVTIVNDNGVLKTSGGGGDEYLKRSSVSVFVADDYNEVTNADEDRTYYAPDGSLVYGAYVDDEISDCIFIVKPKEIDPDLDDDKALDTYVWAVSWIDESSFQISLVGTEIVVKGILEEDEETGDHRVVYGYASTPLAVDAYGTVDGMLNITGANADLGVYNDNGQVDISPTMISFSSNDDPSVSFQMQPVNDSLIIETSCTHSGAQKQASMKLSSSDILFHLPADTYIRGNADTDKVDFKRQWKNSLADPTFQTETAVWSPDANRIVKCTQAQYDALVSGGTVDANTIYCIIPLAS